MSSNSVVTVVVSRLPHLHSFAVARIANVAIGVVARLCRCRHEPNQNLARVLLPWARAMDVAIKSASIYLPLQYGTGSSIGIESMEYTLRPKKFWLIVRDMGGKPHVGRTVRTVIRHNFANGYDSKISD